MYVGVGACLVAAVVTLALARWFGAPFDGRLWLAIAGGAGVSGALLVWSPSRVLGAAAVGLAGVSLVLWCQGRLPVQPYGDGALISAFLEQAYIFPRWMLGMALAVSLYVGIWQFPPVAASLPASLASASAFASLLCIASIAVASVALLVRWNRPAVHCALLTPVWMLFASGYVEYYPLMIGAWVAALAWVFDRPVHERSAVAIGAVAGVLPVLYVALVGLSVLLAITYTVRRPHQALRMAGVAAATAALAISIAYPTIPAFLQQLYAEMNFGDLHSDPRYDGLAASPTSLLLATRYVFRSWHLHDVAYMYFWGGGWLFVPLLAVGAVVRHRETNWRDDRVWLGGGLVLFYGAYLLWMIPKKGPQPDVDLFCPVFVLVAFLAGLLVEGTRWQRVVLSAAVGVDVVTATYLVWVGLPPV